MNSEHEFSNKVALVTGGSSGIGRATVQAFAKRGAEVIIADLDKVGAEGLVEIIEADGGNAHFIECDVTVTEQVESLVDNIVAEFGNIDCAFNNAGISIESSELADSREDDFDRIMKVNVKGVWLCMKYELAAMYRRGCGAIVNTASVGGLGAVPKMSIYSASKHAVLGLTKTAAIEYADKGIRVNAVCPAVIDTEMTRRAAEDPDALAIMQSMHPVGRLGTADEVAAAVLYLCSPAAGFTTGIAMPIDGGMTAI